MNIDEMKNIASSFDKQKFDSMLQLLKERKYAAFLKAFLLMLWALYGKYLKGKFITVKGKKIPLTAIIVAVLGIYIILPSSDNDAKEASANKEGAVQEVQQAEPDPNSYDKDGLKIYGFQTCGQGICGVMENTSNKTIDRVIISVTFNDRQRNVVAEGNIDAHNVAPMTKMNLQIDSDTKFHSFTLSDVTVE